MKRLRVWISAHEFSPYQGSECAVGWNYALRMAQYHDVTVFYASGSQFAPGIYESAVQDYIARNGHPEGITFIAIPQPRATRMLARINRFLSRKDASIGLPALYYLGYRWWQKAVYRRLTPQPPLQRNFGEGEKGVRRGGEVCEVIHHLNAITFREPGYLWKLGIPFVWGPTGGTASVPASFYPYIGLKGMAHEMIRSLTNYLTLRFSRRVHSAIKQSKLIYSFSRQDQQRLLALGAPRVELLLDAGTSPSTSPTPPLSPDREERGSGGEALGRPKKKGEWRTTGEALLRAVWVGRIVPSKALGILVEVLRRDPELARRIHLTLIGEGPLRKKFEKELAELQVKAVFTGWISREEVAAHLSQADLMIHTSLREGTSHAVLEALSAGVPVICHDVGGLSLAIDDTCGIKIPLVSYKQSVEGFHTALTNYASLQLFHENALSRADALSWDRSAAKMAADYYQIVQQS